MPSRTSSKITQVNDLFLKAIESQDIELLRDSIYQGADVTIHGNYGMEFALENNNTKIAETLLEERFNILKNSNPIGTLLGALLTKNPQYISKLSKELSNPSSILYAYHHCTPKNSHTTININLVAQITQHTNIKTLSLARKELQTFLSSSATTKPRFETTLKIIKESLLSKGREAFLCKFSNSKDPIAKTLNIF